MKKLFWLIGTVSVIVLGLARWAFSANLVVRAVCDAAGNIRAYEAATDEQGRVTVGWNDSFVVDGKSTYLGHMSFDRARTALEPDGAFHVMDAAGAKLELGRIERSELEGKIPCGGMRYVPMSLTEQDHWKFSRSRLRAASRCHLHLNWPVGGPVTWGRSFHHTIRLTRVDTGESYGMTDPMPVLREFSSFFACGVTLFGLRE